MQDIMIELYLKEDKNNRNPILDCIRNFYKTPLANFLISYSSQIRVSIPSRVPPRSIQVFRASRFRHFLHIAFRLVARRRQGICIK